jgi:hypothetical protein
MEFDKICTWFDRVERRDWFGAPNREEAREWLRRCELLLEEFEAKVFEVNATDGDEPPVELRLLAEPDAQARPA